jgi:hypothetical protein
MRNIRSAFIAMAAIGAAALTASAANAQSAMRHYGPPQSGRYHSYGADRPNPSVAPNGWDVDSPRDQQLQGTR